MFQELHGLKGLVAPTVDSADVEHSWPRLSCERPRLQAFYLILVTRVEIRSLPVTVGVNSISPFMGRPCVKEDLVKELLTFGKDGREQHSIKISVIPSTVDS